MGITGLLPFLKTIQKDTHLSSLKGKRAAVDAYCWLHRGSYSCSLQLVMGTEQLGTLPFIKYCMKKVNQLRQHDITPILVFDGGRLPTKAHTETERRQRRKEYLAKGKQLLKEGKRSEAVDCFQKSVDVSPEMALALIKECRKIGVECVVAPYEADAQLTYLVKEGLADLVITEDSDLLVFGCERVLFKLDDSGHGKLVELRELGKANKGLVGFTQESFRQMCILSGCDYLSSVPGIGLGKSLKLMKRCNQNPSQVIKTLQTETGKVPQGYEEDFRRAEQTFLYQLVFDPRTQREVRLHPLPDHLDSSDVGFAGVEHSPKKAVNMSRGNIDPISQEVLDCYSPSKAPPPKTSSWSESVLSGGSLPIQARLPLIASERSRGAFRAPKRRRDSVDEPDLCSLYGENAESSTSQTAVDVSVESQVDGSMSSRSEDTETVRSRFFSTSPTEATPSELMTEPSHPVRRALTDKQLSQHSSDSVRKQLFSTPSTRESVRMLHSKFQYSKRQRTDAVGTKHPFELLEQSFQEVLPRSEVMDSSPSRNPFLVSQISSKQSPSFSVTPGTQSTDPPQDTLGTQSTDPPQIMTSRSFITPHPSLQQVDVPTSGGGWLSRRGPSTAKQSSKKVGRVGLPKSTSGSKFKAPRPTGTQTTLGGYVYTRRPQLKH